MSTRPSRFATFIAELRRRHVGRVAITYAAAAFVVIEAGDIVLGAFSAPGLALRMLVVVTLLGFPVAVVLAWIYEVTPKGIRRTEDVEPAMPGHQRPGRMLPRLVFLGLTLATVAVTGWWMVRWSVPDAASGSGSPIVAPSASESGTPIRSLAVLPLQNFSQDGEQDYFSAGMHEALIAQLSHIEALRVTSRTSVMRYAGTTKSMPQIASELNVQGIVEGSVLRAEGRIRITVQLIHGPSDRHLWANSYERELKDIIALQAEVAQAIAQEIQAELGPDEETRFAIDVPVDPEAHEAYLRGRFEQSKGTAEALQAAIQHYEEAVEQDSSFAPAFTGLAGSQLLLAMRDTTELLEMIPVALAAAEKAMALDETSAETQAVWAEAHRQFAEAHDSLAEEKVVLQITLDSLEIPDEEWVASFTEFGKQVQKVAVMRDAEVVGAIPPPRQVVVARRLANAGEYETAVELLSDAIEHDPELQPAWDALEHIYAVRGDYEKALAVRKERIQRVGVPPEEVAAVAELARAVAERGEAGYWEWLRRDLELKEGRGEPISHVEYAAASVKLGFHAEAIERLERAYEARDSNLLSLPNHPVWDPLRGDRRFVELLRRIRRTGWAVSVPPHPPRR